MDSGACDLVVTSSLYVLENIQMFKGMSKERECSLCSYPFLILAM